MENKILIDLLNDLIGLAYETMNLVDYFIFGYNENDREEDELLEGEELDHFRLTENVNHHEDIEKRFNSFVQFRSCTEQIEEMIRTNNFENLYDTISKFNNIEYNLNDQLYNEAYSCNEEEDMAASESRGDRIEYIISKVCDIFNSSIENKSNDSSSDKLSLDIIFVDEEMGAIKYGYDWVHLDDNILYKLIDSLNKKSITCESVDSYDAYVIHSEDNNIESLIDELKEEFGDQEDDEE